MSNFDFGAHPIKNGPHISIDASSEGLDAFYAAHGLPLVRARAE